MESQFFLQGSKQCLHRMPYELCWMTNNVLNWKLWCEPIRRHKLSPFEPKLSCEPLMKMLRATCRSPRSSDVPETPCGSGEAGTPSKACRGYKMLRGPDDRGVFPPSQRVDVVSIATSQPAEYDCHATRWSLDDIATTILNQNHAEAMSRSTIWRILEEADLKPHKSEYWLNSHDPDFDEKARDICKLYVDAPQLYQQGRLVICSDEKTGMQILERKHPTKPAIPGIPERREHEYIRHGTRVLINSFAVPTGQIAWTLGQTRTSQDFVAHLDHVVTQFPEMERYDWILDNLNTHWSLDVCQLVAQWCDIPFDAQSLKRGVERRTFLTDPSHKHVFHFTPKHGSWLNQVELWFGVLQRRFLSRGEFGSATEFEQRLTAYLEDHNAHYAHPYRWTYTGQPLVRATPFDRTRRQQQHGRAWFSRRPKLYETLLYPPRPYRTAA